MSNDSAALLGSMSALRTERMLSMSYRAFLRRAVWRSKEAFMTSMRTAVHDADALPRFPKLTYIISAEITRGVRRDAKNAVRFTICLDKPCLFRIY